MIADDNWSADIEKRVEKLEKAVFPPGGPGLTAQLEQIDRALEDLKQDLSNTHNHVDGQITKLVKIVASLQEALKAARGAREHTAGA